MSIQSNFPALDPTLLLDFANTKQLDPRITFTRASTATFYGTQTAKAEENLFLQSQTFQTNWTADRLTVTVNTTAAPDGTTTADTITNTTANGAHVLDQASTTSGYSIISGLPYTISVFAKKSTNDFFQITTFNASNTLGTGRANFNLATGAAGTVDGGTSTITDVGNGWYRCTYTVTASASGTVNIYFGIITTSTAARFESYTGLGTEAVFIWGAQLEQRSAVTAYTATTTQPITNYIPVLQTAASGVARFDHNPITFESLGLEIEEQRTNLLVRSEEFNDAAWLKTNVTVTSNTIVAPDGALTGDQIVPSTAGSSLRNVRQVVSSLAASTAYSYTVYAKIANVIGSPANIALRARNSGGTSDIFALFTLTTGVAGSPSIAGADFASGTSSIQAVGNGWYRCVLTFTAVNALTNPNIEIWYGGYTSTVNVGDIFIWGAQLEAGAFPTSYIQTVASQVTRAADAASMTGTNFSSWYNAAAGTVYVNASGPTARVGVQTLWRMTDETANNVISSFLASDGTRIQVVSGGVTQADQYNLAVSGASEFKYVSGYVVNNVAGALNAVVSETDLSALIPATNNLQIGSRGGVADFFNGTIKKIAYYPLRVTNANLQALTS
jgi:hypothetical protein